MSHLYMHHTLMNHHTSRDIYESCHTCTCITLVHASHYMQPTYTLDSCHRYPWVMSHLHMHHTYESPQIRYISIRSVWSSWLITEWSSWLITEHASHLQITTNHKVFLGHVTLIHASHIWQRGMSHVFMRHITLIHASHLWPTATPYTHKVIVIEL